MSFPSPDDNGGGGLDTRPPEGRHYPSPFIAFALTFASLIATTFIAAIYGASTGGTPDSGTFGIGFALGLGLVATLGARLVPEPQADRIGLQGFSPSLLPTLALLIPLVLLTSEIDNWIVALTPPEQVDQLRDRMIELRDESSWTWWAQIGIYTVGLAPVVEGFLFRGVIQQGVIGHLGRPGGLLFAALLSCLWNIDPSRPESTFVGALVIGLVLGVTRIATGSLLASILLHMSWNSIAFAAQYFADTFPIAGFNVPDTHTAPELVLAGAVAVAFGLRRMLRAMATVPVALPVPPPRDHDDD